MTPVSWLPLLQQYMLENKLGKIAAARTYFGYFLTQVKDEFIRD